MVIFAGVEKKWKEAGKEILTSGCLKKGWGKKKGKKKLTDVCLNLEVDGLVGGIFFDRWVSNFVSYFGEGNVFFDRRVVILGE